MSSPVENKDLIVLPKGEESENTEFSSTEKTATTPIGIFSKPNLRPKRKTRQSFRDLANNGVAEEPETTEQSGSTSNVATSRPSRKARKRRAPAASKKRVCPVKKVKLNFGQEEEAQQDADEVPAPVLERIEELEEGQGGGEENQGQGGDDDNSVPPNLEKMTQEVPCNEGSDVIDALQVASDSPKSTADQQDIPPLPRLTPSPELSLPDEAPIVPLLRVPTPPAAAPKKKKKAKGRNGNIYIGVANRIWWLKLQQQFGFDNINSFGNFVMGYMNKVHCDFEILHQVAVNVGLFEPQGLAGFRWVNGLPHPINAEGDFIQLPTVQMSQEYCEKAFKVAYDLCLERGKFLVELATGSVEAAGGRDDVGEDGDDESEESTPPVEETTATEEAATTQDEGQQEQEVTSPVSKSGEEDATSSVDTPKTDVTPLEELDEDVFSKTVLLKLTLDLDPITTTEDVDKLGTTPQEEADDLTTTPRTEADDFTTTPQEEADNFTNTPRTEADDLTTTPKEEPGDLTVTSQAKADDLTTTPRTEADDLTTSPQTETDDFNTTPNITKLKVEPDDVTTTPNDEPDDLTTTPKDEPDDLIIMPKEEPDDPTTTPKAETDNFTTRPKEEPDDLTTTPQEATDDLTMPQVDDNFAPEAEDLSRKPITLELSIPPITPQSEPSTYHLNLDLSLFKFESSPGKENIDPNPNPNLTPPSSPISSFMARSLPLNNSPFCEKTRLRQILGDITLDSICSPENFTPLSTPKDDAKK
ncbi:uncharacterized protein LOC118435485 isoform X2 [Folsomia candida]|uniref:uncharacterized protein LOC118435485 isoform X2 n=1 Tax=Folsomia candida TaxID=158441 RepID=UPI00160519DE|nr:uncharacterized protein LOC118435485 isoform X2 [Folsomia candida]